MTRVQNLFAGALLAASVAAAPAAFAQCAAGAPAGVTCHVIGAGSSAQLNQSAYGANALALSPIVGASNSAGCTVGTKVSYHWSNKSAATLVDTRSSNINPEPGNAWVVWTADCTAAGDGNTNVHDIWSDVSVDSTVGVRAVLAQEATGPGVQMAITAATTPAGKNAVTPNIWPDNNADLVTLPPNVVNSLGTGATIATVNGAHVNLGMTDIRPEDALFATTRSLTPGNANTTGLGYRLIANNPNFGTSIKTGMTSGGVSTGTIATPEAFALGGGNDPITGQNVASTETIPVGAAPIIFGYNHGTASTYPLNLKTGIVEPAKATSGATFDLAHLFDGTDNCDTSATAISGGGYSGALLTVNPILREPLSGTMNTTEYSLFRTQFNPGPGAAPTDSQEKGISNAGAGFPKNPVLNLPCGGGAGGRYRAIGTGEVTKAIKGGFDVANALGYFFWSFGNSASASATSSNYLTLDGIDPIGFDTTPAGQAFVNCAGPCATTTFWASGKSYPSLRNGTYPAWSLYRWVAYTTSDADTAGPKALAQFTQDTLNNTIADFVPFSTSDHSDGLEVYHSHFTVSVPKGDCAPPATCVSVVGNNGNATTANTLDGGNTLGGGPEAGGDVGGLVQGPFGVSASFSGTVNTNNVLTAGKGYSVSWHSGQKFVAGTSWQNKSITIAGSSCPGQVCTINNLVPLTATVLYVTTNPAKQTAVAYSGTLPTAAATHPGVLNKKR